MASEKARIEASGGKVVSVSVPRVEGMLSISRALGDFDLESKGVTWQPSIRVLPQYKNEGDFIVLASDGLFDMVTDFEAVRVVRDSLRKTIRDSHRKRQRDDMFDMELEEEEEEEEEDVEYFRTPLSPRCLVEKDICQNLISKSFDQGAVDNISVILVRFPREKSRR
eukprot:TRINITY_DN1424_c0_g1_i1.p1 TRINITY_DN1424_c0_g1~~TRINITY_DN1424_c0_g1_i1.p1  ORF type:complete len:167 (+),score=27.38 TRINITY_DN1424_c0_g1_i1:640-1140(+)